MAEEVVNDQETLEISDNLRAFALTVEGWMGIEAADITPDPTWNEVSGANGQGKTALLMALFSAISGKRTRPDQPIKRGANRAVVKVQLGQEQVELILQLVVTPGDERIEISAADGRMIPRPQEVMNALRNTNPIDPVALLQMDKKTQAKTLLQVAGVKDTEELEKELRKNRESQGREVKRLQSIADGKRCEKPAKKRQDPTELQAQYKEQQAIAAKKQELDQTVRRAQDMKGMEAQKLSELEAQLKQLQERITQQQGVVENAGKKYSEAVEAFNAAPAGDPETVHKELMAIAEVDAAFRQYDEYLRAQNDAGAAQQEYKDYTKKIDGLLRERTDALAKAKFSGDLSYSPDGLLLGGLPLEQCSASEQLKACMDIAMAASTNIKIIWIKDGSLLDENSLAEVYHRAKERGFQVFVERVDTSGTVGIVIRSGRVEAVNEPREFAEEPAQA